MRLVDTSEGGGKKWEDIVYECRGVGGDKWGTIKHMKFGHRNLKDKSSTLLAGFLVRFPSVGQLSHFPNPWFRSGVRVAVVNIYELPAVHQLLDLFCGDILDSWGLWCWSMVVCSRCTQNALSPSSSALFCHDGVNMARVPCTRPVLGALGFQVGLLFLPCITWSLSCTCVGLVPLVTIVVEKTN